MTSGSQTQINLLTADGRLALWEAWMLGLCPSPGLGLRCRGPTEFAWICRIRGIDELWRTTQNKLELDFFHFFPTHFSWDFSLDVSCRTCRAGHMWCLLHVCCPRLPLRSALHRWDQGRFDMFINEGVLKGFYLPIYYAYIISKYICIYLL